MVSCRKVAVFLAVVGMLCGVASIVEAAHTSAHKRSSADPGEMGRGPGKPEMILQGPVIAVSPETGFVVMRHGGGKDAEELPIDVTHQTSLMRGGKTMSVDDIKVGDRIRVSYSGQPGDVRKTVDILGGPSMRSGTRRGARM